MSKRTHLDVSPEEQRFLRQSFHRFAMPYLIAIAVALGWLAWSGPGDVEADASEELAALRGDVETLRGTLDAIAAEAKHSASERAATSKKLGALQGRLSAGSGGEVVALERALDSARQDIADLESRLAREAAAERLAALSDRIARLERDLGPRVVGPAPPEASEAAPPAASGPVGGDPF